MVLGEGLRFLGQETKSSQKLADPDAFKRSSQSQPGLSLYKTLQQVGAHFAEA